VPFCAAVGMAPAVVLSRYSVPEWVRSIDDSGAVGGAHSTGCRTQFRVQRQPQQVTSLLAPVTAPGMARLVHSSSTAVLATMTIRAIPEPELSGSVGDGCARLLLDVGDGRVDHAVALLRGRVFGRGRGHGRL
jgi:hypothetical protein